MKINDSIKTPVAQALEKQAAGKLNSATNKNAQAKQATQTDVKSAENVTLSPLSAQLKSLEEKVSASSVFNAEKVEAIKSAIANGKFKVDSEKVADGLISSVKDFLSAQKSR